MTDVAPIVPGPSGSTPLAPPAASAPTTVVVGPSSSTFLNKVKEWAHQGTAVVGGLMALAYAATATVHNSFGVNVTSVDWKIGAIGAGVVTASKVIDSYAFTALNKP